MASLVRKLVGESFDYDLAVIGGGSGGLACAKMASSLGAKTILFNYVVPTVHGTTWGLGGTCVNVGCIPKKLMHRSARIGHTLKHEAKKFGWNVESDSAAFAWSDLIDTVQNYVKQLNFSYRSGLRAANVEYVNAFVRFKDSHCLTYQTAKGEQKEVSAKYILLAVGGRPRVPFDVPGAKDLAITSDDLFSLKRAPGKTLVVGGSYIALECAGFLTEMGFDTKILVRSILLRGFDRQCAGKVEMTMAELGCRFVKGLTVKKMERFDGDKIQVTFSDGTNEVFDTVLYATGRQASTEAINLEAAGIKLTEAKKIICNEMEQTNVTHIYAIGDTVHLRPELAPVALKAGELLARRLFKNEKLVMDYHNVATTVFTPIEYGCVGLSEEEALAKYGEHDIEVYLFEFNPVEVSAAHWEKAQSLWKHDFDRDISPVNLSKLICVKSQKEKVIGFHCIGLNAGETTQGYAMAIKAGLTKAHFDATVGIHPTDAESFHSLTITRRSGLSWVAAGGCGGGKCG